MKRTSLVVFGLLVLAIGAYSSLTAQSGSIKASRQVKRISKSLGKYKVTLTEVSRAPGSGSYWGEGGDGDAYVDDISVLYNGESVDLPFSCYSDLANVNDMKITPVKGGLVINIKGADAGNSYDAQIVLSGGDIVRRSVKSGEFPDLEWEKTQYRHLHDSDID